MTTARSFVAALGRRGRFILASRSTPPALDPDGPTRVLVTGAAGLIGGIVRPALAGEYQVRGLDVTTAAGVDWIRDMRRLESIAPAFADADVVVDLAAVASAKASWNAVLENNLPATVNAFEAARRAGVRRVIFASSNHAVGAYEHDEPWASIVAGAYEELEPDALQRIGPDAPVRPDGPYGVGKVFGEAVGRYYADASGISVICLRIGTVNEADRPTETRHFATLITHRDLVSLVRCSIAAPPDVRFGVVYGVSRNAWRLWDVDAARDVVGFVPEDDAEVFRTGPPGRV